MSPLAFMRATRKAGLRKLDAYAHHPYYGSPSESPTTRSRDGNAVTLANMSTLIKQVDKLWGKKRIWITEYGYQTPPDRQFGVSFAAQRRYVTQAFGIARRNPRIDLMVWFMLKDDTNIRVGWQSGFLTADGRRKPAFSAFAALPH